jgi:formate hydrogenlyase subunit 4
MIPMISAKAPLGLFGGVLAVVYLLGLGRFFLALAAWIPAVRSAAWAAAGK